MTDRCVRGRLAGPLLPILVPLLLLTVQVPAESSSSLGRVQGDAAEGSVAFQCTQSGDVSRVAKTNCWLTDGVLAAAVTSRTCAVQEDIALQLTRETCVVNPLTVVNLDVGGYRPLTGVETAWATETGSVLVETSPDGATWQPWLRATPSQPSVASPAVWARYLRLRPDPASPGAAPRPSVLLVDESGLVDDAGHTRPAINNGNPSRLLEAWPGTIAPVGELHVIFVPLSIASSGGSSVWWGILILVSAIALAAGVSRWRKRKLRAALSRLGTGLTVGSGLAAVASLPLLAVAIVVPLFGLVELVLAYAVAVLGLALGVSGMMISAVFRRAPLVAAGCVCLLANGAVVAFVGGQTDEQRRIPAEEVASMRRTLPAAASPVAVVGLAVRLLHDQSESRRASACSLLAVKAQNRCVPTKLGGTIEPRVVWQRHNLAVVRYGREPRGAGSLILVRREARGWALTAVPSVDGDPCLARLVAAGKEPTDCA